jgi:hypothetical protein
MHHRDRVLHDVKTAGHPLWAEAEKMRDSRAFVPHRRVCLRTVYFRERGSKATGILSPSLIFPFVLTFAESAIKCVPSPIGSNNVGQSLLPVCAVTAISPRSVRYSKGLESSVGTET